MIDTKSKYSVDTARFIELAWQQWLQGPLGKPVTEAETMAVKGLIASFRSEFTLGVGAKNWALALAGRKEQAFWLTDTPQEGESFQCCVADFMNFPIAEDSIDILYLAHCLENVSEPHALLREAARVLKPEGKIIITTFNPFSLFGLAPILKPLISVMPQQSQLLSILRLKDWLALLGFEVALLKTVFFRPPIPSEKLLKKMYWLEAWGRKIWPYFGGVSILVAQKKVLALTPIRPILKRPAVILSPAIHPANRI